MKEPSEDILTGRRAIESIKGCLLLNDLKWIETIEKWHLKIQLIVEEVSYSEIKSSTDWHVIVDDDYPWGSLKIYPDKEKCISQTYQHQNHNNVPTEHEWRSGDLCLSTNFGAFALRGFDSEPKNAKERLGWHVRRCIEWILAASKDELVLQGQFFELPHFPLCSNMRFFFSEDQQKLTQWKGSCERTGIAELLPHRQQKSVFIKSFNDLNNKPIIANKWNDEIDYPGINISYAMWILLDFVPVLPPWEAPLNWGQLKKLAHQHNLDLFSRISSLFARTEKHSPTVILLGFPVPRKAGGSTAQIHWQPLSFQRPKFRGGFRGGAQEAKEAAKIIFHDKSQLNWMDSQNGNLDSVSSRGRLDNNLNKKHILLIGAGALGSVLSECLVRSGCENLTVLDPDKIELGNMSRHTLTTQSLDKNKAEELSKRLSLIFPALEVKWIAKSIQSELSFNKKLLTKYDLIIDATGSDEALHYISCSERAVDGDFISISLGMNANRLYFYGYRDTENIEKDFKQAIRPWLDKELESAGNVDFPREGLGCWHPLFPARVDDIFMMSGASVKLIEDFINGKLHNNLYVIEQNKSDNGFSGLSIYTEPSI